MKILIAAAGAIVTATALVLLGGVRELRAPAQPVSFSHKVHAGDNLIGCTYCHAYAERAPLAGIPSMARCQGCHQYVGEDKPAVRAVLEAFERGERIEWVRVHRVPDHVYFTHERHVAAGIACAECHGPVETMESVRQVAPLTMGWCLDCHEKKQASTDCLTCHK